MPTILPQSDALHAVSRHESYLQLTLQTLLDAQSEGLLAGLGGAAGQDEPSSAGSRTPTTDRSTRFRESRSPVPVRQPVKKKVGLRGARTGIGRLMGEMTDLKREEVGVLEHEVGRRKGLLSTVDKFDVKTEGLRDQIRDIESEDASRRVVDLRQEEQALGQEIHELETKLFEMRARQRHLLREIDGLSNSVQSKLSSYKSALQIAEKDVRRFLARPPVETTPDSGLWTLPKERRTLEMAREQFRDERETLLTRQKAVEGEQAALEEGAVMWDEVVQIVTGVEKLLRGEMQRVQPQSKELLETSSEQRDAKQGMRRILAAMQEAKVGVECRFDDAEGREWKLLVVAVGAELEALREGMNVLEAALAVAEGMEISASEDDTSRAHKVAKARDQSVDGKQLRRASTDDDGPPADLLGGVEDEDGGPGPDLLFEGRDE
ncbi:hypothetical protein MMC21_004142 [Puttea exsequens]|nr:hypothetical protein [Puttea exsequens]